MFKNLRKFLSTNKLSARLPFLLPKISEQFHLFFKQFILLGQKVAALLHQRPDREPQAVHQRELRLQLLRVGIARVRHGPLVRREPVSFVGLALIEVRSLEFNVKKIKIKKKRQQMALLTVETPKSMHFV